MQIEWVSPFATTPRRSEDVFVVVIVILIVYVSHPPLPADTFKAACTRIAKTSAPKWTTVDGSCPKSAPTARAPADVWCARVSSAIARTTITCSRFAVPTVTHKRRVLTKSCRTWGFAAVNSGFTSVRRASVWWVQNIIIIVRQIRAFFFLFIAFECAFCLFVSQVPLFGGTPDYR